MGESKRLHQLTEEYIRAHQDWKAAESFLQNKTAAKEKIAKDDGMPPSPEMGKEGFGEYAKAVAEYEEAEGERNRLKEKAQECWRAMVERAKYASHRTPQEY